MGGHALLRPPLAGPASVRRRPLHCVPARGCPRAVAKRLRLLRAVREGACSRNRNSGRPMGGHRETRRRERQAEEQLGAVNPSRARSAPRIAASARATGSVEQSGNFRRTREQGDRHAAVNARAPGRCRGRARATCHRGLVSARQPGRRAPASRGWPSGRRTACRR